MVAVHRGSSLRDGDGDETPVPLPPLRGRVAGLPQLLLEVDYPHIHEPPVQAGAEDLLHDDLLPLQGQDAGRADRDGTGRLTMLFGRWIAAQHRFSHNRAGHERFRVCQGEDQEVLVAIFWTVRYGFGFVDGRGRVLSFLTL